MLDDNRPYALVVDDDPMILINACDILEDAGFRPLEAYTVDEALDRLRAYDGEITLLFTDVELGVGRNGFELAAEAAKRWPDLAIVVASGAIEPDDDVLPPHATFIRKPFSADIVHDRLQEILPDGRKPEPLKRKASR